MPLIALVITFVVAVVIGLVVSVIVIPIVFALWPKPTDYNAAAKFLRSSN